MRERENEGDSEGEREGVRERENEGDSEGEREGVRERENRGGRNLILIVPCCEY